MSVLAGVVVPLVVGSSVLFSPELRFFPGSYFDSTARMTLQHRVMAQWPGPSELVRLWHTGELTPQQKTAVLIGAAVYHDPQLLPIYREAIESERPRVRQAAAYGYRDLLADQLPGVTPGVDMMSAKRLAEEMDAVATTLRTQPLAAMWLQGALNTEGAVLPGYRGVVLNREPAACMRSVERVLAPEDLGLLVTAYLISDDLNNRISLMRLISAVTLTRFLDKPRGPRQAWGGAIYSRALDRLDAWIAGRCRFDFAQEVSTNLHTMGLPRRDPLEAVACFDWQRVLLKGDPEWWAMAAGRLYDCGGPWVELSILQADSEENRDRREYLLNWFMLRPAHPRNPPDRSRNDAR